MVEKITVYGLEIPEMGFYLLVCRGTVIIPNRTQEFLRGLFDNKNIKISIRPDVLESYKEITIEDVWVSDEKTEPYTWKWSRGGIAVIEWNYITKGEKKRIKENFEKLFKN